MIFRFVSDTLLRPSCPREGSTFLWVYLKRARVHESLQSKYDVDMTFQIRGDLLAHSNFK